MFYGAFPPEFNSGRMYAGPGAGSLLAAAAAWDDLATELQSTASSYSSVISSLTGGPWIGPSSLGMAAAVTPYVAWMQGTAAQAHEAAMQATAAASAYQTAFAAHVPPPVIAENRALLAQLMATNLFGQNTAAIAANEAQYSEFWAQDALAMDSYASSSAAAAKVTPFTEPPQTTSTAGTTMQAAAVTQAAATPAGNVASAVSAAASTTTATDPLGALSQLATNYTDFINGIFNNLLGPNGSAWVTALYSAIKTPLGFTTGYNDIGLLINFPHVAVAQVRPSTRRYGALPKDALGAGLGASRLGRGTLFSEVRRQHGKCRHVGGKAVSSAELGHGHASHQDGRCRVVGRRAGCRAGSRARRRRVAQFDVGGRDARQRNGCGRSHRSTCRRPRPSHPDQRPQRQKVAGATQASCRTNIGEARKRAAPHSRSRRP